MDSTTSPVSQTGLDQSSISARHQGVVPERHARLIVLTGALLVLIIVIFTVLTLREKSNEQVKLTLNAFLDKTSSGVSVWYKDQESFGARLVKHEKLRNQVIALLDDMVQDRGALLADIESRLIRKAAGLLILDATLSVKATNQPSWNIAKLSDRERAQIARAISGSVVVTNPIKIDHSASESKTLILLCVPVLGRSGISVESIMIIAFDPIEEFTPLFEGLWRQGKGESMIVSDTGQILVTSSSPAELQRYGVTKNDMYAQILNIPSTQWYTESGELLGSGAKNDGSGLLANSFMNYQLGLNVEGYSDYRGIKTVGAWRWLKDRHIGITCNIDYDFAFAARRKIETWLLVALVVTVIIFGIELWWINRITYKQRLARAGRGGRSGPGSYEMGPIIGEGAMGAVYKAAHKRLNVQVAIKVIRATALTKQNISRFQREARLTSRLTHPNTVRIFDFGNLDDGSLYYVMEYLEGITLLDLVTQFGPLSPERVIYLICQVLGALSEAHQLGLVHRDVKASNIMVGVFGGIPDMIKLVDFGLARDYKANTQNSTALTIAGTIMGSPACIAPEMIEQTELPLDGRVDLYSVGCVAYYLLTGKNAFEGETVMDILQAHIRSVPEKPSQRTDRPIPPKLEAVIMQAIERMPENRPQTATAFRHALLECQSELPEWEEPQASEWWINYKKINSVSSSGSGLSFPIEKTKHI